MNTTSSQVVHDILSQAYMRTVYTASVRHVDILGTMLYDLVPAAQEDFEYPENEARAEPIEYTTVICSSCNRRVIVSPAIAEMYEQGGEYVCGDCSRLDPEFLYPAWGGAEY